MIIMLAVIILLIREITIHGVRTRGGACKICAVIALLPVQELRIWTFGALTQADS